MVFVLLYTPCVVSLVAERHELGAKWMWFSVIGQFGLAWLAAHILGPLRRAILHRLQQGLPTRESHLVASVLLGERDAVSNRTRQPFARLGLAHLFAVSGLHVGIILAVMAFLSRPFRLHPSLRLAVPSIILPIYVILTGDIRKFPQNIVGRHGSGSRYIQSKIALAPFSQTADQYRL